MRKRVSTDNPFRLNRFKNIFPYLALIILLFLSVLVWQYYKNTTLAREERRFNESVDRVISDTTERLHRYEMILLGGAGVFAASEEVTRDEWQAYYKHQQVDTLYPGVQRIAFSRIITHRELAQHIEGVRAEGFPDYTVWPAGDREFYAPLIYLEPFDNNARTVLGFDLLTDPIRQSALEQARDSGKAALSGMMLLVSETTQGRRAGFLLVVPVYENGLTPDTVEERRQAIKGYAVGAFIAPELVAATFTEPVHEIGLHLYDGTEISPETLLYDSHVHPEGDSERRPLFTSTETVDLYGHQWTLVFETMSAFEAVADRNSHWAILGAGLLISVLIFLYLKGLTTTGDQAHLLARKMTAALRESEEKYRFLAENLADVIWTADLEGNLTYISPTIEELIGFTPEEVMAMPMRDYVVQEDYDAMMALLSAELAKSPSERKRSASIQACYRTKDNRLVYVELNASWILDERGNTAGVQGTTRDITARKQLEDEVRTQRDEINTLYTFSTVMRTAKNTEDLFTYILREACRLLQADAGMVSLLSPDNSHFIIAAGTGYFTDSISLSFPVEQGLSGHVLQTQKPVACENYGAEPRALLLKDIDKLGPAALVPLHSEEALVGVLAIARSKESNNLPFTPAEVRTLAALGEIAGNALRRQFLFERAQKRLDQIQTLRNIDMAITGSLDLRVTFSVILDEITGLLKTDAAAIIRLEPHTGSLKYAAWRGFNYSNPAELNLRLGEGFAGRAAMSREPIHVSDLKDVEADKFQGSLLELEGFMAYYGVPLIAKGHVQGVLEIYHREPFHSDGEWLEFLEALAGQTAIAIDNAELFHNMERTNFELIQAYDATIEGWAHALDLKDEETEEHSRRVTEMTLNIARMMNVKEDELAHVHRGALLHDIGKMGIPDAILLKPGKLTDEEWVIMRKHPVYAHDMLAPIDYLKPALDIPYCHHEKFDGTGYPRGLKGKAIPLAARIFAVADVYDALTSDRPYRKAWSKEKTLALIKEDSGTHFDPEVVEVFLKEIEGSS